MELRAISVLSHNGLISGAWLYFLLNERVKNHMGKIIFYILQKQRFSFYTSDDTKAS